MDSHGGSQPPSRSASGFSRSDWKLLLVLVAIQFTHMVDFVIIMPLGGRLMSELSITTSQFGWVLAAYAWSAGLASLFASPVMDRFDRKHVLLVMYAGFTLSTLVCGVASTYELLLVSRALAGAFGGLAAVAIMAVIGDVFPPEKRGRATGALMSSFAVASIAGLPLGLALVESFGRGAPFIALAGVSAIVWILTNLYLPAIRGHLSATRRHPLEEFVSVVKNPRHLWAFGFTFFTVMGAFTVASFIGPYLSATNGWTEQKLAVIYFFAGLLTLVGMNIVGRLADRFPRKGLFRIMAGSSIFMSIIVTNLPACHLAIATIVMSLFMVFAAGRMVPAQALLLGVARPEIRGSFLSLNTAVQHLATGIAPMVAGLLTSRGDQGELIGFPVVGLVAAATAGVSLILIGQLNGPKESVVTVPAARIPVSESEREPKPTAV